MYLNNMAPLPINSNPGWVFPKQKFMDADDMLKYLAKLIFGLCNFKQQLESNNLPEELAPGRSGGPKMNLCMKQYERLLNAYRKPGNGHDVLECSEASKARENEHIIVMAYNHLFKMPVKVDGKWLDLKQLFCLLSGIQAQSETLEQVPIKKRIPLLTSEARNVWSEAREMLIQDDNNVKVLDTIESCLFVACLDYVFQNPSDEERSQKDMFRQMLTGMGVRYNGSNRWFDKTIQLIVCMDGSNGMCYEHTAAEGVAVVTATVNAFKLIETLNDESLFDGDSDTETCTFTKLDFNVDSALEKKILDAAEHFDKLDVDTDNEVFSFHDFGKSFIKTCNCSPDAFMQMSLQLAYFRLYETLCPTYESASTRRFHHGRVDSIRASHPEALSWTKAMMDDQCTRDQRRDLFKKAISKQTLVTKENIFGEGVDIPLLGIRNATQVLWPDQVHPLFKDPTYSYSNLFKLSTSQVPINLPGSYMGYGAVVPDGYGVSYNLQNDQVIFAICSFFSCESTNSRRFAEALTKSLQEMKDLFIEE